MTLPRPSAYRPRPVVNSPRRRSTVRSCLGCLALALAMGCEHPSKPPVVLAPKGDTPEAKLARVMERLKFALHSAQGAPGFGVASQRDCQYRLIPPSTDEPRYTAEISIETRVIVADKGPKPAPKAPPKPPEGAAPIGKMASADDGPNSATSVDQDKFLLVYEHDRWSLPTKPDSQTLQICFDSALAEE
jgi:hypothetical protein